VFIETSCIKHNCTAHTVINRRWFVSISREKRRLLWSWRCSRIQIGLTFISI